MSLCPVLVHLCLEYLGLDLFFLIDFAVPVLEVRNDDAEARLREVMEIAQKMRVSLGAAVGTIWYQDPELRHDMDSVLVLLQMAPTRWPIGSSLLPSRELAKSWRASGLMFWTSSLDLLCESYQAIGA